jgi:sulfur dioxygenase
LQQCLAESESARKKGSIDVIFRQLFDSATSTFTYLLADEETREAVLIDTVYEQHLRDLAMLRELDLKLLYTLETHVHADHATGAWLMQRATGSKIVLSKASGAKGADQYLVHGDTINAGGVKLEARATPGHTDSCMTYVLADHSTAFTGDALLIRGAGRTDFQQGSAATLYRSVREQIFSLPANCHIYPGHDYAGRTMTTVAEERAHNPRIGDGVRERDFVGYMDNLGLPHPKRMDEAVPANMQCGKPTDPESERAPDWAPVVRTFAGIWQVEPDWVHAHLSEVTVVDVREFEEVRASPLGSIADSIVIPLGQLRDRAADVPRGKPVVTMCPAGARSAHAAKVLEKAGIEQVANLRGGIIEWRALGFPLETKKEAQKEA